MRWLRSLVCLFRGHAREITPPHYDGNRRWMVAWCRRCMRVLRAERLR